MTISSIRERLARIESLGQSDPEAAHCERDALFIDAITYMGDPSCGSPFDREECPDAFDVSREVLKALNIKMRWDACA